MDCTSLLMLVLFSLAGAPQDFDSAEELERAVIQARREIRNGSFDVMCVTTGQKSEPFEIGVRCSFDLDRDESFQFERSQVVPSISVSGKRVTVIGNDGKSVERIIVSKNQFLNWSPDEHSDGSKIAATISMRGPDRDPRFFDPRVVGLSAESRAALKLFRVSPRFCNRSQTVAIHCNRRSPLELDQPSHPPEAR
jgi:hypothetical protein